MTTVLEQAMGLSVEEKLQLIAALWDSMALEPDKIPVAEWQLAELERRIEAQRTSPERGQTRAQVKQEIRTI